jgi:Ca2+-binding RTX toxin-like protein
MKKVSLAICGIFLVLVSASMASSAIDIVNAQFPPDVTPPVIVVPANIQVANDPGQGGAVVNYPDPTATDDRSAVITICFPGSGSAFPVGTTTVTCRATDAAGNSATGTFTITVVDNEPPVIRVPADITVQAASPAGAVVNYPDPTATDNQPVPVTVTCSPQSGSTFPVGTTQVLCTATDAAGNSASAAVIVTVTPFVPSIPPPPPDTDCANPSSTNLLITGTSDPDTLIGNNRNNIINGLGGNDRMNGCAGSDSVNGNADNDGISGGIGDDLVSGGDGDDNVQGGEGSDIVAGIGGINTLTGGPGNDLFLCGRGGDTITDFTPGQDIRFGNCILAPAQSSQATSTADGSTTTPSTLISIPAS